MKSRPSFIAIALMLLSVLIPATTAFAQINDRCKSVIAMTYRAQFDDPLSDTQNASPSTAGCLYDEAAGVYRRVTLVCADWSRNVYLMNPLTDGYSFLECLNSEGKLLESWKPIQIDSAITATSTKGGYVWVAVASTRETYIGLPLVVYRRNTREPVMDWRYEVPQGLDDRLVSEFAKHNLEWQGNWSVEHLESGPHEITVTLWSGAVGNSSLRLWLRLSENGSRVIDIKLMDVGWILSPAFLDDNTYCEDEGTPLECTNGGLYENSSDRREMLSGRTTRANPAASWSKVWTFTYGASPGGPILNRESNIGIVPKDFDISEAYVPLVQRDGAGDLYLLFARAGDVAGASVTVEGDTQFLVGPTREAEHALLVTNASGKVVQSIGWTSSPFNFGLSWIKPIPDGSGFYRMDYENDKAVIYFHALQNP